MSNIPDCSNALRNYEEKKQQLLAHLAQFSAVNLRIAKDTSNLFRQRPPTQQKINVRQFCKVILVDQKNLIAEVEGMATYATLVDACLSKDCLPLVVPELKTITIGGALSGGGIESSSFRYGLVHESILEFEALLSDGSIVLCRPDNEHRDLFYGFPNTYGTLGYALRIKLKLRTIKPFIKLTHQSFEDPRLFFTSLANLCKENRESITKNFIEGVVFNARHMIISQGEFIDSAPYLSDYTYLNIYYQSITQRKEDYLTTHDYIWRWDTDWFWCSKFFYVQHWLPRLLLGRKFLNSKTYWKIRHFFGTNAFAKWLRNLLSKRTEAVIQDVQIPIHHAEKFLQFFQKEIGIYPIWICPTQIYQSNMAFDFYPLQPDVLYLNFGFWDVVQSQQAVGYYNQRIEQEVSACLGKKSLYSEVYYSEVEFWAQFSKTTYEQLKQKYDPAQRLQSLYQKCVEK